MINHMHLKRKSSSNDDQITLFLFTVLVVHNCEGTARCQLCLIWTKAALPPVVIKRCYALRVCLILITCSCLIGGFLLLRLLLLMSGDVESNPGPKEKTSGDNDFFLTVECVYRDTVVDS